MNELELRRMELRLGCVRVARESLDMHEALDDMLALAERIEAFVTGSPRPPDAVTAPAPVLAPPREPPPTVERVQQVCRDLDRLARELNIDYMQMCARIGCHPTSFLGWSKGAYQPRSGNWERLQRALLHRLPPLQNSVAPDAPLWSSSRANGRAADDVDYFDEPGGTP